MAHYLSSECQWRPGLVSAVAEPVRPCRGRPRCSEPSGDPEERHRNSAFLARPRRPSSKGAPFMSDNKLTRREFLGAAALAAGGAAVASSFGATAAAATKPRLRAQAQPVTINFWSGIPLGYGGSALTSAFNATHSNIKLSYTWFENVTEGNTKLDSALSSGQGVDVYFSYGLPYFQPRITDGVALSLAPFISSNSAIDAWVKAENKSLYTANGKYYGLPTVFQPQYIWANEAILNQRKVSISPSWTINDFANVCRELSYKNGSSQVYGTYESVDLAGMKLGGNEWYTTKAGKLTTDFSNPIFRQSWQLWRQLIVEDASYPWTDVLAESATVFSQDLFIKESFALWPGACWEASYLNDDVNYPHKFRTTAVPYPNFPSGTTYNDGSYANFICIFTGSKNQEAAWEVVSWFMTEGCKYYMKQGDVPAMPGVVTDEQAVASILGPQASKFFDVDAFKSVALDRSVVMPPQTIAENASQINTVLTDQLNLYLTGQLSLNDLVSKVQSQTAAIF